MRDSNAMKKATEEMFKAEDDWSKSVNRNMSYRTQEFRKRKMLEARANHARVRDAYVENRMKA